MADRQIIAVAGATGAQGGGLCRAILDDPGGGFACRAITRDPSKDEAQALAGRGAEVVRADLDDLASLKQAFTGAHGAFCVTNFWEHFSAVREKAQARNLADAARCQLIPAARLAEAARIPRTPVSPSRTTPAISSRTGHGPTSTVRHRFSLSGVWNLPLGNSPLLREWERATFMQFQSGRPFSVFRPEQGLLRLGFQRLDFESGANADSVARQAANPEDGWFDTTQLRAAAAAGNTPRNFLRGPAQKRVDLSIARRIPLGGRVRAELRWEIFNLLNTVNFALPENNSDSIDFGTITGTIGGPRVSQFGLRVLWLLRTPYALHRLR